MVACNININKINEMVDKIEFERITVKSVICHTLYIARAVVDQYQYAD